MKRIFIGLSGAGLAVVIGCVAGTNSPRQTDQTAGLYPPAPQTSQVIALGNIRGNISASNAETQIALFLFGAEPQPGLALVKPCAIDADDHRLFICDSGLGAVLQWNPTSRVLDEPQFSQRPIRPNALRIAPNGDLLVADIEAGVVSRFDGQGALLRHYALGDDVSTVATAALRKESGLAPRFRPAGIACIGREIWVSNVAAHAIEVFDADTGKHLRTIGHRGGGPAEFGVPLGLSATPDGNVLVADMLNNRVQLLDAAGNWVRDIGRAGRHVGCFGRPKDVAVGTDGIIFVADAATQRVHAFDPGGRSLLAFGEPGSGVGELALPNGICISRNPPMPAASLPSDFEPAYYVLVAEQLLNPGVRVYAWRSRKSAQQAATIAPPQATLPGAAPNPHWSAERCTACHQFQNGRALALAPREVDPLCLSCHDGRKAKSEAHPVGRLANKPQIHVPADWPLVAGRTGCLTCHDIRRHCDAAGRRPDLNPAMVRDYDIDQPLNFCSRCHVAAENWRTNPHLQLDAEGRQKVETCGFCHTSTPLVRRESYSDDDWKLRVNSSQLCLGCHSKHFDPAPQGHLERLASAKVLLAIARHGVPQAQDGAPPTDHEKPSPLLPLAAGRVTCFSCHNPHAPGLFPPDSPFGRRASDPREFKLMLRVSRGELCLTCHVK